MEVPLGANVENQERLAVSDEIPQISGINENDGPHLRVVGSQSSGAGPASVPPPPFQPEQRRPPQAAPAQGRALATPRPHTQGSTLQRALNLVRTALPLVQKLLPMIDGNLATTVSNILAPRPQAPPTAPPQPSVNLAPLQEGLAELQTQHRELREQFSEQNSSLKRVEDRLEMVREATDRNTLEQQELLEDLKTVGSKVNLVAVVAIGLLAFSVLVNLLLYMHIQRVLP